MSNSQHRNLVGSLKAIGKASPQHLELCKVVTRRVRLQARIERLIEQGGSEDEIARRKRELAYQDDQIEAQRTKLAAATGKDLSVEELLKIAADEASDEVAE